MFHLPGGESAAYFSFINAEKAVVVTRNPYAYPVGDAIVGLPHVSIERFWYSQAAAFDNQFISEEQLEIQSCGVASPGLAGRLGPPPHVFHDDDSALGGAGVGHWSMNFNHRPLPFCWELLTKGHINGKGEIFRQRDDE